MLNAERRIQNGKWGTVLLRHSALRIQHSFAWRTLPLIGLLYATGCSVRTSTFGIVQIVEYRDQAPARRYHQTFDEAYFDLYDNGHVEVVLRRRQPGATHPDQGITQVIHLRSVWRSIPGRTVAERTQINGTVRYRIVAGRVGDGAVSPLVGDAPLVDEVLEGAGALFFKHHRRRDILAGKLECAMLRPKHHLAGEPAFLKRAELSGTFRARRDPRRVARIINDLNRQRLTGLTQ